MTKKAAQTAIDTLTAWTTPWTTLTVRAESLMTQAESRGDYRPRCITAAHLVCDGCGTCACAAAYGLDATEYPFGRLRVGTDKQGRTMCRECRYLRDKLGN